MSTQDSDEEGDDSPDLTEMAEDIRSRISDDVDVDVDEVEAKLDSFINGFQVPEAEAERSTINKLAKERDMTSDELLGGGDGDSDGDADFVNIEDIDDDEEWVSVEAKFVDDWTDDNDSDSIAQVGLLDDGTDRIKFVSWAKSELPLLAEGESYRLTNVTTDYYEPKDRYSINLNSQTEVEMLDEDIEESDQDSEVELTGAFVSMQSGSGLIIRDVETGRPVQNDSDAEETEYDLRIKGVLDDGEQAHQILFNREMTEAVTDIRMEEAKEMAREALDRGVVAEEMAPDLIGNFYKVTGRKVGDYVLVDEFEEDTELPDVDSLLVKARSM